MWYRINEDVEYSPDMAFFLEEQIGVSKSNNIYSFYSRIEKKEFKTIHVTKDNQYKLSDEEINTTCREIHAEIFAGKHGNGELIN